MADTRIKKDGTTEYRCYDCETWFRPDEDTVDENPNDPNYLKCPECRDEEDKEE